MEYHGYHGTTPHHPTRGVHRVHLRSLRDLREPLHPSGSPSEPRNLGRIRPEMAQFTVAKAVTITSSPFLVVESLLFLVVRTPFLLDKIPTLKNVNKSTPNESSCAPVSRSGVSWHWQSLKADRKQRSFFQKGGQDMSNLRNFMGILMVIYW